MTPNLRMTLSTIFYRYLGQAMVLIGPIWFFVLFIWGAWEFNFSLLLKSTIGLVMFKFGSKMFLIYAMIHRSRGDADDSALHSVLGAHRNSPGPSDRGYL